MKVWLKISLWLGILGIVLCIIGVVGINSYNVNVYEMEEDVVKEIQNGSVSELNINVNSDNVKIISSDTFKVEGKETKLNIYEKNGVLSIENKTKLNVFKKSAEEVKIYVPEDYVFDKVKLEVGAGKVEVDKLNVKNNFDLEIGGGTVILNDIKCDKTMIEVGAGEIKGKVESSDIDIDCGAGDINLEVVGNKEEYSYELDVGVGKLKVGDIVINGIGKKEIGNESRKNIIKVDCGAGNINIEFSK